MARNNKACWNCANFGAHYTKGFHKFDKTQFGKCSITKEILNKNHCCKNWRNTGSIRSIQKEITLSALNDILNDISAIKQILEEFKEEEKINPNHISL